MRTSCAAGFIRECTVPYRGEMDGVPRYPSPSHPRGLECNQTTLAHPVLPHEHATYLIAVVLAGSGQHEDELGRLPLMAGDVRIIGPGHCHAYPQLDGSLSLINVTIPPEYLIVCEPLLARTSGLLLPFARAHFGRGNSYDPRAFHGRLSAGELDHVRRLLLALSNELQAPSFSGQEVVCGGLLLQILGLLDSCGENHVEFGRDVPDDVGFESAIRYLEEHLSDPVTVRELASHVGYSRTSIARKFRQQLGMSPSAYLLQLRLQHACTLLRTTRLPVTSIAWEVGFRDSRYFATRFRQAIGVAPSEFRASSMTRPELYETQS